MLPATMWFPDTQQQADPALAGYTVSGGLLATYLTALSFFNIPGTASTGWELYLVGGLEGPPPESRVSKEQEDIVPRLW